MKTAFLPGFGLIGFCAMVSSPASIANDDDDNGDDDDDDDDDNDEARHRNCSQSVRVSRDRGMAPG